MKTAIGIDLGTTSISAVVLNPEEKKILEKRNIPGGSFLETKEPWARVQDAGEIIQKAKNLLDSLIEQYPNTRSIGIDCQMHGIVYLDADGRLISPLYIWQDGSGNVPSGEGETLVEEIWRKTGYRVASGYGLVTHIWHIRRNEVPENASRICTIGDYLVMALTGKKEPEIHISNAAGLGFFDAEHHKYNEKVLDIFDVKKEILPRVSTTILPHGTYRGCEVYTAIGDNQASFLGAVGLAPRTLLVNMGTGSQISMLTDRYIEVPGMETRPITGHEWLIVGASLCGGRAYALLERFFREYVQAGMTMQDEQNNSQYALMERLAWEAKEKRKNQQPQEEAWMKCSPLFCGTREKPMLRGSITKISEDNFSAGEMILSLLEGMVQELYDMYDTLVNDIGIPAKQMVMSGNGIRKNKLLQNLICERFSLDFRENFYEEEAACGAGLMHIILANREEMH